MGVRFQIGEAVASGKPVPLCLLEATTPSTTDASGQQTKRIATGIIQEQLAMEGNNSGKIVEYLDEVSYIS